MVEWAIAQGPVRVVDPGCGSGRFSSIVAAHDPNIEILAIDVDALATLACRAVLACRRARNVRVLNADFISMQIPSVNGRTDYIGNPPYTRHHDLTERQKRDGKELAKTLRLRLSGLAGLHVYFLLASLRGGQDGDVACFITSAEWLDIGYGQTLRRALLDRATHVNIHVVHPEATVFQNIMTTAAITCLEIGEGQAPVRFRVLRSLVGSGDLNQGGRYLPRKTVAQSPRWGALARNGGSKTVRRTTRLGDIVRVSRGAVTGCNQYFLLEKNDVERLGLAEYVIPVISSAKEVFEARGSLRFSGGTRLLLDPPKETKLELSELSEVVQELLG